MTNAIGVAVDTATAKKNVDDLKSDVRKMRDEFAAVESRARAFNDAVADIRRAAFQEMANDLKAVADQALGATSEVKRLKDEIQAAARQKIMIAIEDQRERVAGLLEAIRAVALAADKAATSMARFTGEVRQAVLEGGKLQAVQARPSLLSGSSPAQLLLPGPSQIIDVQPINASTSALARLREIALSAVAAVRAFGSSAATSGLAAIQAAARGAQTGLSSLATLGSAGLSALNTAARATASGGLTAIRYAALGFAATMTAAIAATIAPFAGMALAIGAPVAALGLLGHVGVRSIGMLQSALSSVASYFSPLASMLGGLTSMFGGLARGAMGVMGAAGLSFGFLAKSAFETADAFTLAERKIDSLAGGVTSKANEMRSAILGIASDTRTSIESATSEFNKLSIVLGATGASTQDIAALATAVNASMKLSGASAVEAERAFVQFSQGVSKGKFELQDLKSIAQSAPGLMQIMSAATGKTMAGLNEAMKKGGDETKRVMDQILNHVAAQAPILAQKLAMTPRTMGEAMQSLKNTWFQSIGEMQKNSDFMGPIIGTIDRIKAMLGSAAFKEGFASILRYATETAEALVKWISSGESFGLTIARAVDHMKNLGAYVKAGLSDMLSLANVKLNPFSADTFESEISKLKARINAERDALTASDRKSPFTGAITGDSASVNIARARDELDKLRKEMMEMPEAKLRLRFETADLAQQKASIVATAESTAREAAIAMQRAADANGSQIEQALVRPMNRAAESFSVLREQMQRNEVSPAALDGFKNSAADLRSQLEQTNTKLVELDQIKQQALGSGNVVGAAAIAAAIELIKKTASGAIPTLQEMESLLTSIKSGGGLGTAKTAAPGKPSLSAPVSTGKASGAGANLEKSMEEKLAALKAENELLAVQITGNGDLIRAAQLRLEIEKALTAEQRAKHPELAKQIEAQIKLKEQQKEQLNWAQKSRDLMAQGVEKLWDGMMRVGEGTLKMKDFMKQFLVEMIKATAQAYILKPLLDSIKNPGSGGGGGNIISSLVSSILGQANGGAWSNGVQMFANGGVVGRATMFRHAGGLGVMGEAGPEAIMPLTRMPGGKLGVKSAGGGGTQNITVAPVFHVAGDMTEETRARINQDIHAAIAMAQPGTIKTAVAAVRRENTNNPNYLKR